MESRRGARVAGAAIVTALACLVAGCGGGSNTPRQTVTSSPPTDLDQPNQEVVLGALLPRKDTLEGLGYQSDSAMDLAMADINNAGGVLGRPMQIQKADSGSNGQTVVYTSLNDLFSQRIDLLIGPMTSSLTLSIKPLLLQHNIGMINPAATADAITQVDSPPHPRANGAQPALVASSMIARTVPDDSLLGRTLGTYIHGQEQDAKITQGSLSVIASNDPYGASVGQAAADAYQSFGLTAHPMHAYDPAAVDVNALVEMVRQENPTSVVVVGLDESARIVEGLAQAGFSTANKPAGKRTYVAGTPIQGLSGIGAGAMNAVVTLRPGAQAPEDFRQRITAMRPDAKDFSYMPETYDAVVIAALAAEAAKSDGAVAIAAQFQNVTRGGQTCTSFQECKNLLAQGVDINYDGVSGPCDLTDDGNLARAVVGVYTYDGSNNASYTAAITAQRGS